IDEGTVVSDTSGGQSALFTGENLEDFGRSFSAKQNAIDFSERTAHDLMDDYDNRYSKAARKKA
ncbi:MAG: hypothetical protein FWH00_01115, partial [Oscillospiraceae bacterium]|nr:hypothetical protein [Oscillospiraceae bacterium]